MRKWRQYLFNTVALLLFAVGCTLLPLGTWLLLEPTTTWEKIGTIVVCLPALGVSFMCTLMVFKLVADS